MSPLGYTDQDIKLIQGVFVMGRLFFIRSEEILKDNHFVRTTFAPLYQLVTFN